MRGAASGLATLAAIALSLWLVRLPAALPGAALGALAVAIARIDAREFRIPDLANLAAAALALAAAALSANPSVQLAHALARGLIAFAAFYLFRELYRRWRGVIGLGLGDVKLAGVAGLWLDFRAFSAWLELACAAALAYLLVRRWRSGEPLDPELRLPFGAFLAPALWLVWLWRHAQI